MTLLLDLHKSLFAGLPGTLFVGAMGLLLAVAVISGCIVYAPFMRKLPFGAVRRDARAGSSGWTCTTCSASRVARGC